MKSWKIKVTVGVTALGMAFGIPAASAHTVLISSTPEKGGVIKKLPALITLKFADPLLTLGKHPINQVSITDPMGMAATDGKAKVAGAVLTAKIVDANPMPGIYKVSYRVSAQDGHIVTGTFTFKLSN